MAFDVTDTTTPKLLSKTTLNHAERATSYSSVFSAGSSVYLSHRVVDRYYWWHVPILFADIGHSKTQAAPVTSSEVKPGYYLMCSIIQTRPTQWPATPSAFLARWSASRDRDRCFTRWDRLGMRIRQAATLHASAYDGTVAHLVDSIALGSFWSTPALVSGETVWVGWRRAHRLPLPPRLRASRTGR